MVVTNRDKTALHTPYWHSSGAAVNAMKKKTGSVRPSVRSVLFPPVECAAPDID